MIKKNLKNNNSDIQKEYQKFKQTMDLLRKEQNRILKDFLQKMENQKLLKVRKNLKK